MKTNKIILCAAALIALNACSTDMNAPGNITEHRIQVEEKSFIEEMDTDLISEQYLSSIAYHYSKHGRGGLNLMLGYDPTSQENTSLSVADQAANLVQNLKSQGVHDVSPSVIPIKNLGDKSRTIISYTYFDAYAPEECDVMAGFEKTGQVSFDEKYKLGCTIENVFAKQIARPRDLVGNDWDHEYSDGRRASNVVERYRTGAPNELLDGESATDSN